MAHSLLLIPVPEADFVVRPRLERRSPELLPADPHETVAHITLLSPFADLADLDEGVVSELRSLFADVLPFAFRLTSISRFPGGKTYLSPAPVAPFHQLTRELFRRFPEFPPYGGDLDDFIPHLSVPVADDEDVDQLHFALGPRLPIMAHAQEAVLYWWEPGKCRALERFRFGTTAA